jgi:hypothetical protein
MSQTCSAGVLALRHIDSFCTSSLTVDLMLVGQQNGF